LLDLTNRQFAPLQGTIRIRWNATKEPNTLLVTTSHSFKGYDAEIVLIPCADQYTTQGGQILAATYLDEDKPQCSAKSFPVRNCLRNRQNAAKSELNVHIQQRWKIINEHTDRRSRKVLVVRNFKQLWWGGRGAWRILLECAFF